MEIINDQTLAVANELEIPCIDIASYFATIDVSALIYDAWHFTEKGCRVFADYVNRRMEKIVLHE